MQADEKDIDAALDAVLKASGSGLRHFTMPGTLSAMREAMRGVIDLHRQKAAREDESNNEVRQ